jgi:hypothetical protein
VVYVRNKFWVVVDHITTDRPRDIQGLWHFHPHCTVDIQGNTVTSTDADKGNVRITPISLSKWHIEIIKGQEEPFIQGWYSREYNHKQAASCAIFKTHIEKNATFAWVITPGKGIIPNIKTGIFTMNDEGATVKIDDTIVQVPLQSGKPSVE